MKDYEAQLSGMKFYELLDEYEQSAYDFGARQAAGVSAEKLRLCRREVARRFASQKVDLAA